MTCFYFWTAEVVIAGQGLHDASGSHRAPAGCDEADLKAAIARGVAAQHGVDPADVTVLNPTYTTA